MGRLFSVKSETMKDIADAIREKTQKTKQIKTKDMANEIRGIPTGSGDSGVVTCFSDINLHYGTYNTEVVINEN